MSLAILTRILRSAGLVCGLAVVPLAGAWGLPAAPGRLLALSMQQSAQTPPAPESVMGQQIADIVGKPKDDPDDQRAAQEFVTEASEGSHGEIALGRLAADKGKRADVRGFGQRMQRDHGQANQELTALAKRKGWKVATGPGPKNDANEQRLNRLAGEQFDRAYMQDMVKDHEKDVRMFEQASKQLEDAELRAWILKMLPTLREHLERARTVNAAVAASAKPTQ
jgi:putative membrane protein